MRHGHDREEGPAPCLLRAAQDGEARPDREGRVGQEKRDGRRPEAIGRVARLLTPGGDDVHEPEAGDGEEPLCHRRPAGDVGSELRTGQHECERRQPDPRPEERHARRPDERGRDEQEGHDRRARAEDRRRGEDGDEAEGRHELRVMADGDGGRRDGCHECAQQAPFDRDQVVQAGRGEQGQGNGREADRHEDMPERAAQPRERQLTEHEEAGADDEPDEDAQRLGDPAAAEGQAQEEDCSQEQGDAADDGKQPALEPCFEPGARPTLAGRGRRKAELVEKALDEPGPGSWARSRDDPGGRPVDRVRGDLPRCDPPAAGLPSGPWTGRRSLRNRCGCGGARRHGGRGDPRGPGWRRRRCLGDGLAGRGVKPSDRALDLREAGLQLANLLLRVVLAPGQLIGLHPQEHENEHDGEDEDQQDEFHLDPSRRLRAARMPPVGRPGTVLVASRTPVAPGCYWLGCRSRRPNRGN